LLRRVPKVAGDSIVLAFLWISLGAIAGANARYWISSYLARILSAAFPYGTLIINASGSFVLGFFMIWTSERVLADPRWRLLVAVGFCGGYTTFSSYAFETVGYAEQGQWMLLALNFLSNNVVSIAAVVAGMALARVL
jgi:CrcB protein